MPASLFDRNARLPLQLPRVGPGFVADAALVDVEDAQPQPASVAEADADANAVARVGVLELPEADGGGIFQGADIPERLPIAEEPVDDGDGAIRGIEGCEPRDRGGEHEEKAEDRKSPGQA